jgi:hypothetical protein
LAANTSDYNRRGAAFQSGRVPRASWTGVA